MEKDYLPGCHSTIVGYDALFSINVKDKGATWDEGSTHNSPGRCEIAYAWCTCHTSSVNINTILSYLQRSSTTFFTKSLFRKITYDIVGCRELYSIQLVGATATFFVECAGSIGQSL